MIRDQLFLDGGIDLTAEQTQEIATQNIFAAQQLAKPVSQLEAENNEPLTPVATYQSKTAKALAFDEDNTPDDDADLMEWAIYDQKVRAKREAGLMQTFLAYQARHSSDNRANLKEAVDKLGSAFAYTPENLQAVIADKAAQSYSQAIDEMGALPREIMYDPEFMALADEKTYAYAKTVYDMGLRKRNKGFWAGLSFAKDIADKRHDLNELKYNQEITPQEAAIEEYKLNEDLKALNNGDEPSAFQQLAMMVDDIQSAVADNPKVFFGTLLATAGAEGLLTMGAGALAGTAATPVGTAIGGGAGFVAGFGMGLLKGLPLAFSAASGWDTYKQEEGAMSYEAMNLDPTLTMEEAKKAVRPYAALAASADLFSDVFFGGVLGKGTKQLVKRLGEREVKRTGKADAAEKLQATIEDRIKRNLLTAAKDFTALQISELSTEGAQGVLEEVGARSAAGLETTAEQSWKTFQENVKAAFGVTALLGVLGNTPRAGLILTDAARAMRSVDATKKSIEEASVAKQMMDDDPKNEAVLNKINPGAYATIKAQDIKEKLAEVGMSVNDLPERYQNLEQDLKDDPEKIYSLTLTEFSQLLDSKYKDLLLDICRTSKDGMTMREVARIFKPLGTKEELDSILSHDVEVIRDKAARKSAVKQQVTDGLINQGILKAEQADATGTIVSNLVETLADDAGMQVDELYNTFDLHIEQYHPTLDLGGVKHDDMHPQADTSEGVTVGRFEHKQSQPNWKVVFRKGADFKTVLHEFAHFYLQALSDLDSKLNATEVKAPKLRQRLEDVSLELGLDKNFNELSAREQNKVHEQFVSLFLRHYINTGKTSDTPLVRHFRRWLIDGLRKTHLTDYQQLKALQDEQKQRIKEWQKEHPEEMKAWRKAGKDPATEPTGLRDGELRLTDDVIYGRLAEGEAVFQTGVKPPEYSTSFAKFMDAITMADQLSANLADMYRGTDSIITTMMQFAAKTARDNEQAQFKLPTEVRESLLKLAEEWREAHHDASSQMDDLALLYMKGIFDVHKSLSEIKHALLDLAKEGNPEWVDFLRGIEGKLDALIEEKTNGLREEQKLAPVQALRNLKFNPDEIKNVVDNATYNLLKKQGRLDPSGYRVKDLRKEYLKRNTTRQQMAALIESSTVRGEDQLHALAKKRALNALEQDVIKNKVLTDDQLAKMSGFKTKMGVKLYSVLQKMLGQKSITEKQLTSAAKLAVSQMNWGDIDVKAWARQVQDYEKQAQRYLLQQDLPNAALYIHKAAALSKRIEIAHDFQKSIEKQAAKNLKLYTSNSEAIKKRYDQNTLNFGRALLARLGLYSGKVSNMKLQMTQNYAPATFKAYAPLLSDSRFSHAYTNTKISDLMEAFNMLESLKNEANKTAKMRYTEQVLNKQKAGEELRESALQHTDGRDEIDAILDKRTVKTPDGTIKRSTESDLSATRKIYNAWRYATAKVLPLCQELDKSTNGAFTKYIYRPVRHAHDHYRHVLTFHVNEINDALKAFNNNLPDEMHGYIDGEKELGMSFGLRGKFKGNGKLELLGFMLHIGNVYNYRALGEWVANNLNISTDLSKEERIRQGQAHIEQFINRLINQGILDENFFDTLDRLWKVNKAGLRYAQQAHYEKYGAYFKEQENRPIRTPWKTYEGGYAPLKRSKDFDYSAQYKEASDFEKEILNSIPRINSSFTIERTGATGYPVDINIDHLMSQVGEVIRYGIMQPVLDQTNTLLTNQAYGVAQALTATNMPDLYQKVFNPWLNRLCTGRTSGKFSQLKFIDKTLRTLRARTSAMTMFMNINNTVQGLTNILPAMMRCNPRYMIKALLILFSQTDSVQAIVAQSKFMGNRLRKQEQDISKSVQDIFVPWQQLHGFAKAKGLQNAIEKWSLDNAYFLQKLVQRGLDIVLWEAKYQEVLDGYRKKGAISEEMQKEAAAQADELIVTTQGSFDLIDMSNVETSNPMIQLFVQFGNYFFTMADLLFSQLSINNKNDPKALVLARQASAVFMTIAAPAIIADAINKSFNREWDDEEDDALLSPIVDCLAMSPVRMFLSSVPFLGQTATSAYNNLILDKNYYTDTFLNLPVMTMASTGLRGAQRVVSGALGEDVNWYRTFRDAGSFFALLTGIPMASFAIKWASYMNGWLNTGEINPTSGTDVALGVLTGKPSQEAIE